MDRHIKEILGQYLKESKIASGYQSEKIVKIWKEKMGPSVSEQTQFIRLKRSELHIKIKSSVLKFELFQHSEKIKIFLNEELKAEVIKSVKFL
ncbi:MAG: DciA family protein [Saprospiraceae bacterium]